MNTTDLLAGSREAFVAVIRSISSEQMDAPTPCSEWDVRALMQHTVGTVVYLTDLAAGEMSGPPTPSTATDRDELVDQLAEAAERAVQRFRDGGLLENESSLFAGMTGDVIAGIIAGEFLVHGWDLARATGQTIPVAVDVADAYLQRIASTDAPRPEWAYGPEVEAPSDASVIDRIAALLGRPIPTDSRTS